MTPVGVGMMLDRSLPPMPGRPLAGSTLTFGNGEVRIGLPIETDDCDRALDLIERDGIRLLAFNFGIDPPKDRWTNPDEEWVGVVLGGGDIAAVDPANPFDPALPAPCYGLVPWGLPLRVNERPVGHVVGVKDDDVFSARIADFLARHAVIERGPVIIKGTESRGWFRLSCAERRAMIVQESLEEYACRACGTRALMAPGLWLGRRPTDFSVCQDTCGVTHLGAPVSPWALSLDVVRELEGTFRAHLQGYRLSPIIDAESPIGRRIVALLRRLVPLRAPNEHLNR